MILPIAFDLLIILSTALLSAGRPLERRQFTCNISSETLAAAVPAITQCDNPSAQFADECRTAVQAAPAINNAFTTYGITTLGEQATILSIMGFETGGFQYERNHLPAPGRPGQGTRNLMMFPYVYLFTQATSSLQAPAYAIVQDPTTATPDQENQILDLAIQSDNLSFSTGAWFYTTQCSQSVKEGLQAITDPTDLYQMVAWANYTTQCVGTTVTDDRIAAFTTAFAALSAAA